MPNPSISLAGIQWGSSGPGQLTVGVNPVNTGDLLVLMFQSFGASGATAVSGGGVTSWSQATSYYDNSGTFGITISQSIWWGVVTTTGVSTITVTDAALGSNFATMWAREYTATGASWALVTESPPPGTVNGVPGTSGNNPSYPSLTDTAGGNDLYVGAASSYFGHLSAGSTSGFTYEVTGGNSSCQACYDLSVSGTVQPNSVNSDSGSSLLIGAIFTAGGAPPRVVQVSSANGLFGAGLTSGNSVILVGLGFDNDGSVITTSNPTIGGSPATGSKLQEVNSPNAPTGSVAVITAIWRLTGFGSGGTQLGLTYTSTGGAFQNSLIGLEVSGLPASISTSVNAGNGINAGPANSGSVTATPLIVVGSSIGYALSITPPGAPWTTTLGNSNFAAVGYQLEPGTGTYDWSTVLSGAGNWAANIVAIFAAGGTSHTATASLTVTPVISAGATHGHFRTAALTVTPTTHASSTHGHFRTAALTVTPVTRATGVNNSIVSGLIFRVSGARSSPWTAQGARSAWQVQGVRPG